MTTPRTIGLVESATQLLNVLEWGHTTGQTDQLKVAVLAPRDAHTRKQLAQVAALATGAGIEVELVDIRGKGAGGVISGVRLTRDLAQARRVVIGDPFSRLIQTMLPLVRADHLVVVDDGTATWEFAACINSAKPLVRWPLAGEQTPLLAARASRRLSPSTARRLTVYSCLAGATPVGAMGVVNRYEWTRSWCTPEVRTGEIDVVGTSLVDSGVVERTAYLGAVRRLTARFAPVRYLAHRRESDNRLAEIAALPGVRVVRADLPIELALRRGPVAQRIITFPSTAAYTLPVVLADLDVRIEMRRIEPGWFTAATSAHARDFVARIATEAPLRPLLESA